MDAAPINLRLTRWKGFPVRVMRSRRLDRTEALAVWRWYDAQRATTRQSPVLLHDWLWERLTYKPVRVSVEWRNRVTSAGVLARLGERRWKPVPRFDYAPKTGFPKSFGLPRKVVLAVCDCEPHRLPVLFPYLGVPYRSSEAAALFAIWYRAYGARPVLLADGQVELVIDRSPVTKQAAAREAVRMMLYAWGARIDYYNRQVASGRRWSLRLW